jgi:hypothetical protein
VEGEGFYVINPAWPEKPLKGSCIKPVFSANLYIHIYIYVYCKVCAEAIPSLDAYTLGFTKNLSLKLELFRTKGLMHSNSLS